MAYLRYTLSVLCPTIAIAADRGMPARSRFLIAVLLKSCGIRSGLILRGRSEMTWANPALRHAVSHARRNDLMGLLLRWNSQGTIRPVFFSNSSVRRS